MSEEINNENLESQEVTQEQPKKRGRKPKQTIVEEPIVTEEVGEELVEEVGEELVEELTEELVEELTEEVGEELTEEVGEEITKQPLEKALTKQKMDAALFRQLTSTTPYRIYQNGILIARYSVYLKVTIFDTYFKLFDNTYLYNGIEVKHGND
jgi:signal recognition particle GTPase